VQDIFDEVCGAENWQVLYEEHKGNLFAKIGVKFGSEWVWKSDCGTESNVEKEKGEASDSFKRAGVMWGVGRFLYSKKIIKLPVKERNNKWYPYSEQQQKYILDSNAITKWCNQLSNK
jgi:hypothetical protein